MRRSVVGWTLIIVLLFSITAIGQTLDELIEKNIEAHGGEKKLRSINTIKVTGKQIMMGSEFPYSALAKRPNLLRIDAEFQGQTLKMAYDGETAWWIMPFTGDLTPQHMPENEAKNFKSDSDIDGPLLDYKTKGHQVELIGKEDMEGTEVYKLKVTLKSGDIRYYYLDAEYYVELKITSTTQQMGQEIQVDTYLSDYKEIDGILVAFITEAKIQGMTQWQRTVETVELNVDIDDSVFKMPEVEKEQQ